MNSSKPTICLNMIVKNEAHCIIRCLESVKSIITSWVICDNGSTDDTESVVKEYLKDIPGEYHHHSWFDFSTNRNMALEIAREKADYVLFIDADDYLMTDNSNYDQFDKLDKYVYTIKMKHGTIDYDRVFLLKKSSVDCKYVGVLHEYLDTSVLRGELYTSQLSGCYLKYGADGSRWKDSSKYAKDAEVLEKALETEPNNTRYVFYCAQSFKDSKQLEKAIEYYHKRVNMGGWVEERYESQLHIAKIYHGNTDLVLKHKVYIEEEYLKAHLIQPNRAEALCYLARYYRQIKDYGKCYHFAELASQLLKPDKGLFVEDACYNWIPLDEMAISGVYIGKFKESININNGLLINENVPESEKSRIRANLEYCRKQLDNVDNKHAGMVNGKMRIVFYLGNSFEAWDPISIECFGAGGSEKAAYYMARILASHGHDVTVFNRTVQDGTYDGVRYLDYKRFGIKELEGTIDCDILISSRQPYMVDLLNKLDIKSKMNVLWMHDTHVSNELTEERGSKFDYIFVLSNWHKNFLLDYYKFLDSNKIIVTRNGIDTELYTQSVNRNPYKVVYSSAFDRGFDILCKVWPNIIDIVPQAELHIYYGLDTWIAKAKTQLDTSELKKIRDIELLLVNTPRLFYHGRVNSKMLAIEQLSAGVWAYPTYWYETSCITAMEVQAAGLYTVTTELAALKETVGNKGLLIDGNSHSDIYQDIFVNEVVNYMLHTKEEERVFLKEYARKNYDWQQIAEEWVKLFESKLSEHVMPG